MDEEVKKESNPVVEALFKVGAHFGYSKSMRHPSASPYIFGSKNKVEIIDLELTKKALDEAKNFVKNVASSGRQILFVCGKNEGRAVVEKAAESIDMPHVAGRFIGGTLTNFPEIKKRVEKLERLIADKASGELSKYTKKERLLIDREIGDLKEIFGGIVSMKSLPAAIFVIDSKKESIVVNEARRMKIPVIALLNSDCDLSLVDYPIPGNDSSKASIEYFTNEIAASYKEGKSEIAATVPVNS